MHPVAKRISEASVISKQLDMQHGADWMRTPADCTDILTMVPMMQRAISSRGRVCRSNPRMMMSYGAQTITPPQRPIAPIVCGTKFN